MDSTGGVSSMRNQTEEGALLVGTDSPGGALLVGMDSTGGVSSMRNQAEEGALLARMVPAGGEPLMWKEDEEGALLARIDPAGGEPSMRKEDEEGALLARMDPAGGDLSMRKEDEEGALLARMDPAGGDLSMRKEDEEGALLARMDPADGEPSMRKERNMQNKTRQDEEARKTEASVTEVGSPEESVTKSGKPQESVSEAGNRQKVMGKETLQKLLEDTRNKFDILDPNGDDEKDEIDMAKSAIAEEHMPSDWKNPSDRGEESVKLGSSKSAMDKQEVMGKETLHTAPAMLKYCLGMTPECWEKLMKHNNEREAEQEALLADSKKFCQSKSGNSVGAGKSFIPADPCATKSMGHYSVVQDDLDDHDRGNSTATPATKKKTAAEKEMEDEAKSFALHCKVWASKHGKRCGSFFETTVLSSMQFTHYTPGLIAFSSFCCTPVTLQILSIKLTRVDGGLEFPLSVYGVIAVRDLVDRNRNILFTRDIIHRQELKQNDPSLHLIGPSRAILFDERVWFEIELRVVAGSQNKALISCARSYSGGYGDGVYNICFKNRFCTLEVSSQPVKQTVQATILGVQVLHHNESWPLEYGGLLVACSPLSGEVVIIDGRLGRNIDPSSSPPIVLVDSKHEAVPKGRDGFVHLWRQVVSVELQGRLDFDIKSYSKSGGIAAEGCACFVPQLSNISQKKCLLGDAVVTITVAWSRVATSKMGIATESCAKRCF